MMTKRISALLLLAGPGAGPALAEPHFAVREGRACSACHVNVTGGGMRNAQGVAYGLESLPWKPASQTDDPAVFRGSVHEAVSVGADLRAAHASTFAASGAANEFEVEDGNLYLDLRLARGRVHLYADERVAPGGARSREAFALLRDPSGSVYMKAGRLFPAYGWRLLDDSAFIRSVTGFSFSAPDDGIELGWTPGAFEGSLSVTNGNGGAPEQDADKQVSLLAACSGRRLRTGVSAASNRSDTDSRKMAGVLAGIRIGPVVLLGEADVLRTESLAGIPPPGSIRAVLRQTVTFAEADWQVRRGMNLKVTHDYLDPDRSQGGDEANRIGVGGEFTPAPYVRFRLFWRRTDRPSRVRSLAFEDDREVIADLHVFL